MSKSGNTTSPRRVVIRAPSADWLPEFEELAIRIRRIVGGAAARIDHIGSTAVPGLGAKDVVDIQISVSALDRAAVDLVEPLRASGFRQGLEFRYDVFHTIAGHDPELRKLYMREPEGERRVHIHIRELGRFNQRYALLFRDYLRASELVRGEYEIFKRRAADIFPESIEGYLSLKEPVMHIIYQAATLWAERVGWTPGEDCR